MKIDVSEKWLPIYEALASDVRIKIIDLLAIKPMNIKDLASALGLSSAIISMHVRKLEIAAIIKCERAHINGTIQKICHLKMTSLEIGFPRVETNIRMKHEFALPIGHYSDIEALPTCGLATTQKVIGLFDDPRFFLDAERVNAAILWFTQGHVTYKVPNFLMNNETPMELEISLELCSEAPGSANNWPSDISFYFNDVRLGQWTSPGDFGGVRGRYTPEWWNPNINQFGLLKVIKVDLNGSFIDGIKISDVTIHDINISSKQWGFKIAVEKEARNVGGVTLFGSGFGNYDQDILFSLYYV